VDLRTDLDQDLQPGNKVTVNVKDYEGIELSSSVDMITLISYTRSSSGSGTLDGRSLVGRGRRTARESEDVRREPRW